MDEAQWLRATDTRAMLTAVGPALTNRKFRMFVGHYAAAAVEEVIARNPGILNEATENRSARLAVLNSAQAATALIRYADGEVSAKRVRRSVGEIRPDNQGSSGVGQIVRAVIELVMLSRPNLTDVLRWFHVSIQPPPADLIRDLFPNPFRPVVFDPRWRSADVAALVRGIYEERAFDRLPILADALMDAGCEDEQILAHCRGDGPHVRGCWVVDLVLGKE